MYKKKQTALYLRSRILLISLRILHTSFTYQNDVYTINLYVIWTFTYADELSEYPVFHIYHCLTHTQAHKHTQLVLSNPTLFTGDCVAKNTVPVTDSSAG